MATAAARHRLEATRGAVEDRLRRFPDHPVFLHAAREVARIEVHLSSGELPDRPFYDSLTIGLMCARELEAVDTPFCDTVHAMLEAIRQQAAG